MVDHPENYIFENFVQQIKEIKLLFYYFELLTGNNNMYNNNAPNFEDYSFFFSPKLVYSHCGIFENIPQLEYKSVFTKLWMHRRSSPEG